MKVKKGPKKYRIALVDNQPIVLMGLAGLFSETKDLQVCGKAQETGDAARMIAASRPDLVLVDLFLQGTLGAELIKDLRAKYKQLPILASSAKRAAFYAELAFKAGADGYVVKEDAAPEILRAVRALLQGGTYISDKIRLEMIHETGDPLSQGGYSLVQKLSDREMQVFKLLGAGSHPSQIADQVGAGVKTVETYCLRIRKKLHLPSGYDLLRLAIQWRQDIWE
jgi:DNA-binding NarL/FixJ family response regulator